MNMQLSEYKKKVEGCWLGKNIGGTLGAPLECKRGVFEYEFYSQNLLGEPLPNDDLDLQLVWLNAVEKYGRSINASILGEYWQMYITPNWSEYGVGKSNLRMGLVPPLSGYFNNSNKNSCGAFIRSEIWACFAPGHPEIAVEYAYEDSIVDHSHEGVYAEVFFAAIQSAAFVESDRYRLIDIGLSYIPENCAIANVVRLVIESYRNSIDWKELRKLILQQYPTTFGMMLGYEDREPEEDIPYGDLGYDAPANVGITILGWLYGEDDFGKSLLLAVNCGEDADCTAATLGAIFGIIHGADNIPACWLEQIGRSIKTKSINEADIGIKVPKTIDELTDRIVNYIPFFLGPKLCDIMSCKGYTIYMKDTDELLNRDIISGFLTYNFLNTVTRQPFVVKHECPLFDVMVDYCGSPTVKNGVDNKFILTIDCKMRKPQWLTIKWHTPEEWEITPYRESALSLEHNHGTIGKSVIEYKILPIEINKPRYDIIVEIISHGRHTKMLIPIVLLANNQ